MSPYDGLKDTQSEDTMKPLTKSKTFWVNLATAVAGVIATLGGSDLIQNNPQMAGIFAVVIGVTNVLLRLVTNTQVSVRSK